MICKKWWRCTAAAALNRLAKTVFKDMPCISLENPDERGFALNDPKRFLVRFAQGATPDEVQRCPQLLSVRDLDQFQTFMRSAYRQQLNLAMLKANCGNTQTVYFLGAGLATRPMGARDAETQETHTERGPAPWGLCFWRDCSGNEVDAQIKSAMGLQALEIKSGRTFASDGTNGLRAWQKLAHNEALTPTLV